MNGKSNIIIRIFGILVVVSLYFSLAFIDLDHGHWIIIILMLMVHRCPGQTDDESLRLNDVANKRAGGIRKLKESRE